MSDSAVGIFCCLVMPLLALVGGVAYFRKRRRTRQDGILVCSHCGSPNPADVNYCAACGRYLFPSWTPSVAQPSVQATPSNPVTAPQSRPIDLEPTDKSEEQVHITWLLAQLQHPDLRILLPPSSVAALSNYYQNRLTTLARPAAEVVKDVTGDDTQVGPAPAHAPEPVVVVSRVSQELPAPLPVPAPPPVVHPQLASLPVAPPAPPRKPFRFPQPWKEWDSAVILLYLGAFLIVVAGLIYSSYSWERLEGWQKVGLLVLTTIAFTGGGLALLPFKRVRPAAETFIGIGAFLVPMNAIAISNVSRDDATGPATVGEIGAILVTALYGFFAYRPGGIVYRYATAVAALIAVGLLPAAFGAPVLWGAPLVVLATSMVVDAPKLLTGRIRRFATPVVHVGLVVLPVATATGIAARWAESVETWWIVTATLTAAALSVGRLAIRRADDYLGRLWTGLVLSAVASCLVSLDRPRADGAIACAIVATVWLALGEIGPVLTRRPRNRLVLHGEVAALLLAAPFLTDPDARPLLYTLTWVVATAGAIALTRLRDEPLLGAMASVLATISFVSIGNLIDGTDLYDSTPLALLLAPAPLLLVGATLAVHRRKGPRWAVPIWLVAGVEAVVVTAVALIDLATDFSTDHKLVTAAACAAFAVAGAATSRVLRQPYGLLAASFWLEAAVSATIFALPVSEERRLPILLIAHLFLAGFAAGIRFVAGWDIKQTRRWSIVSHLAIGGIALVAMLGLTSVYLVDLRRPPTLTDHPSAAWWWPYFAVYAFLATFCFIVGRRGEPRAVWATSFGLAVTSLLGLRMIYGALNIDPWRWPPIIVAVAGIAAAVAVLWTPRVQFDVVFRRHLIGSLGGLFALPALVLMAMRTAAYALDRDGSQELIGHLAARWWWPDLVVYTALVAGAWLLGRKRDEPILAPFVLAGSTLGDILALRMLYGNIPVDGRHWWPLIAATGLGTTLAIWFVTRGREGRFPLALSTRSAIPGAVVGLPTVLAILVTTAGYVLDLSPPYDLALSTRTSWWWPFVVLFVIASVVGCAVGPRLRRLDLSAAVTTTAVAAFLLLLRMAYAELPIGRLTWLPLLTVIGAVASAGCLAVRVQRTDRFAQRLGTQLSAASAGIGLVGLIGSVGVTLDYVVDLGEPFTTSHAEEPLWWWRFLILHLVVAFAAWFAGSRTSRSAPAPIVVTFGTLTGLLGLRMATTDLMSWSYIGMIATISASALLVLNYPRPQTPFLTALRTSITVAAAAIGICSICTNLVLGLAGEGNASLQAIVYVLLVLTVFGFSLWMRQPLLVYGAVTSALIAIGFAVAALDTAAANAGYAFAALSWGLVAGSLAIPVVGRWTGQRLVWERSGLAVAALPIVLGVVPHGALDPGEPAYQRLILAILSAAGVLALSAVGRRSAIQGYAASVIALFGVLMQIAVAEPENAQAYTAPVAVYLLGLAWFMRRVPGRFDLFVSAATALLMFPSFAQSFGADGYRWGLLCGAEGLIFVFVGLFLGRRAPVAAGVVGLTAIVLRQSVDYVHSLPTWAILAVVGILLLGTGTLWLAAADSLTRRFEEMRARWGVLR